MIFQRISYLGFYEKTHWKEAVSEPIDFNQVKEERRFYVYGDDTFVFITIAWFFLVTEAKETQNHTLLYKPG